MFKSFKIGGIHPKENKLSCNVAIEQMPLSKEVAIYLSQHIGAPAIVEVKKGDTVKVGDLIGRSGGFISANIHSSASGTVKNIDLVKDFSGAMKMAVIITVEDDIWNENIIRDSKVIEEINLSAEDIVKAVEQAGVVGLGGATFPTSVKLTVPNGKVATALVVNGVECEPYLTEDHRLMLEKPEEIIVGVRIACRALGVDTAYIGIERNKIDAINLIKKRANEVKDVKIIVVGLKVKYPQGSEKQLIDATMNRQVPSGKLPIDIGAVVQNVGSIYAIYEAVQKNKPLFERVITVTGKDIKSPKNLFVRVGTPLKEIVEYCGGLPENTQKIIGGGPMMGRAMASLDGNVTKGTSGILMMPIEQSRRAKQSSCIRCGKCIGACPMGLEPYHINALTNLYRWEDLMDYAPYDCIECGSCAFTCPAKIPLLDNIKLAKSKTMIILRSKK